MEDIGGRRVLVVEDEALVLMLLTDMVEEAGAIVVGPASSVPEALELAKQPGIEAALLDVNLNGQPVFPVANVLRERGIPFAFLTGYGRAGLPDEYADAPVLQKPFQFEHLMEQLKVLLS
jgi:CheY-like chemotaxis protein